MLTTAAAAAALGLSRSQVNRLCHQGELRAVRHGRAWVIPEGALAEYRARCIRLAETRRGMVGRPRKVTVD
ncbi:MAG: helix-turn-helix domain-containing protein [Dehalococcoidia bacterium]|nr:helix-turn-helix domain-containing protein [Dehalococcoidia bacterium]